MLMNDPLMNLVDDEFLFVFFLIQKLTRTSEMVDFTLNVKVTNYILINIICCIIFALNNLDGAHMMELGL